MNVADADVQAVVVRCRNLLGPVTTWITPRGYPDNLGLCVLDAVWSMGVRHTSVVNVIGRYRELRRASGGDADQDDVTDVTATIRAAGVAEPFAASLRNRQRTSTRTGVLKAAAVDAACDALADAGATRAADIRHAASRELAVLEDAWLRVPGQRSGISWHYLLILTGRQDVKPDRMIVRFVTAAVGRRPSPAEAAVLVTAASEDLHVDLRALDHRIWSHQRRRRTA